MPLSRDQIVQRAARQDVHQRQFGARLAREPRGAVGGVAGGGGKVGRGQDGAQWDHGVLSRSPV